MSRRPSIPILHSEARIPIPDDAFRQLRDACGVEFVQVYLCQTRLSLACCTILWKMRGDLKDPIKLSSRPEEEAGNGRYEGFHEDRLSAEVIEGAGRLLGGVIDWIGTVGCVDDEDVILRWGV
jgi:hypothetical protein